MNEKGKGLLSKALEARGLDFHTATAISMRMLISDAKEEMLAWLEANKNATEAEICEKAEEIYRISRAEEIQASIERMLGEGDYRAFSNKHALLVIVLKGWIKEKDTILQLLTTLETEEQAQRFYSWLMKNILAKPETLLRKAEEIRNAAK